jgi:D-inositol-3-phosphate glycosyltransferase
MQPLQLSPWQFPSRRVAMLSVHTSPLALLGGKKTGGMNVYVRDLARYLGCHGVEVDVFTRSQDSREPRIAYDLERGVRVIHIPAGPETAVPLHELVHYLDEFAEEVLHFAAAEDRQGQRGYDLIHSHYWLSGMVAEQLREAWKVPIVHMFHTLGHLKNQIAQNESERAPQVRLDGEQHVAAIADLLVAPTPAEERHLVELYGADLAKIVIIPPGVDLSRFHPIPKVEAKSRVGIPCGDHNILFAGRIEPLKGIDTLLRAISILQERHPVAVQDTCVAIIGGDPWADDLDVEMERLQSLRAELGIHDLVTFLGAKDQGVLPYYYAAAEMVVMPSHYESFGMVALEAMAMGTPVIASEVGGLAHLVRHNRNGLHVPSRDPEALAVALLRLLEDRTLRRNLGEQAHMDARAYDWDIIAQRMVDLYHHAEMMQQVKAR